MWSLHCRRGRWRSRCPPSTCFTCSACALGRERVGLEAEHGGDLVGADGPLAQDVGGRAGQVDDRGRGLLLRRPCVQVDPYELAELTTGVVCGDRRWATGD